MVAGFVMRQDSEVIGYGLRAAIFRTHFFTYTPLYVATKIQAGREKG